MSYYIPIKTALIAFPLVAILFTIPFILSQYHKYGSINPLRVLIIYSFILYMICIYFLVILPLPKMTEVTESAGMNLLPFSFIEDILRQTTFVISDPKTYLKAFFDPCIYTVLFNIMMTIPFGMYMRYYFECDLKKTIKLTFLLSLFFELTQLTGLYFIYPHPYRLFDVDDLLLNTLGGALGFFLFGSIQRLLPSRKEIDEKSLQKGTKVSPLRALTIFALDAFLYCTLSLLFPKYKVVLFIGYFIIVPLIFDGRTPASHFLNAKTTYEKNAVLGSILRPLIIYFYHFKLPLFLLLSMTDIANKLGSMELGIMMSLGTLAIVFIFHLINFLCFIKNGQLFYDRMLHSRIESTIKSEYKKRGSS